MLFDTLVLLLLVVLLAQVRGLTRSLAAARTQIEALSRLAGRAAPAASPPPMARSRDETPGTTDLLGRPVVIAPPAPVAEKIEPPPVPPSRAAPSSPDPEPAAPSAGAGSEGTAQPAAVPPVAEAPSPPAGPAALPGPTRRPRARDFEFDLGRRWAVLLGGGTLVIGLVLLVRQTIERGLLPPAARLSVAALASLALIAGAEVLRRRRTFASFKPKGKMAARALPDIPSTLFGAGLAGLFAAAYAARDIYALLGVTASFALLALIAAAGIASSLVYGPPLAVLGYVSAQAVPLLAGGFDDLTSVVYVVAIGIATFVVAHLRRWVWLEALVAVVLTTWVVVLRGGDADHAIGVAISEAACVVAASWFRERKAPHEPTWRLPFGAVALASVVAAGLALTLPVASAVAAIPMPAFAALTGFALIAAALVAAALLPELGAVTPLAALAAGVGLWTGCWVLRSDLTLSIVVGGPRFPALDGIGLMEALAILSASAALASLVWVRGGPRRNRAIGAAGVASAVAALALCDLAFDHYGLFAGLLPALTGLQGAVLLGIGRFGPEGAARKRPAALAAVVGGLGLMAVALVLALSGAWLTTALGLFVLAAAGLAVVWRAAELIPAIAALCAVVILQGSAHTLFATKTVEEGAHLLPLLVGYVLPGVAITAALAFVMRGLDPGERRTGEDLWRRWLGLPPARPEVPGLATAVIAISAGGLLLTGSVLILRLWVLGDAYAPGSAPADWGIAATYALSAALTCRRLHRALAWQVLAALQSGATVAGCLALSFAAVFNPLAASAFVGPLPVINLLLVAYLVPASLAGWLAAATDPPNWARTLALAAALVGSFAWVTFSVTQLFQGSALAWGAIGQDELWAYTPAWLAYGAALLAVGLRRGARTIRLVALAVIAGVACKAFLVDLSELSGVPRALSFIGLGGVLIGIGMAYQRFMVREPA